MTIFLILLLVVLAAFIMWWVVWASRRIQAVLWWDSYRKAMEELKAWEPRFNKLRWNIVLMGKDYPPKEVACADSYLTLPDFLKKYGVRPDVGTKLSSTED